MSKELYEQTSRLEIEYYKIVLNRELSLFNHYSTVRMALLSFLIPLGGLMIVQDRTAAGLFVIFVGYIMNLYFGAGKALNSWLIHKNIDLWLKNIYCWKKDDTDPSINEYDYNKPFPILYKEYQLNIPSFWKLLVGKFSYKDESQESEWDDQWKKVQRKAVNTEATIQGVAILSIIVFISILLCSCAY